MSFASDIARAVRNVIVIEERLDHTRAEVAAVKSDLGRFAGDLGALDRRVVRLEALFEAAVIVRRAAPRLPPE